MKGGCIVKHKSVYLLLKIRRRVGKMPDKLLWTIEKVRDPPTEYANLARFADGAGNDIEDELLELAASPQKWNDILEQVDDQFGRDIAKRAKQLIYRYCMAVVCNYGRRITTRLNQWQCKLLVLAKRDQHIECPERLALAKGLLSFADQLQNVDVVARKVVICFLPKLHHIASSNGRNSSLLFTPVELLRRHWRCDSQELEGIMNMIGTVMTRRPRTNIRALDATVALTLRKAITYDGRYATRGPNDTTTLRKFPRFQHATDAMIADAKPFLPDVGKTMSPARWAVPPPLLCPIMAPIPEMLDPRATLTHEVRWAAHYNSLWCKQARLHPSISDGGAGTLFEAIVPSMPPIVLAFSCYHMYRFSGMFVKLALRDVDVPGDFNFGDDGDVGAIVPHSLAIQVAPHDEHEPPAMAMSYDVFRTLYRVAKQHGILFTVKFYALHSRIGGAASLATEGASDTMDSADVQPLSQLAFTMDPDVKRTQPAKKHGGPTTISDGASTLR